MGWLEVVFGKNKIRGSDGKTCTVSELFSVATEVAVRELALSVCVNMVASAIGRCEFQVFREKEPFREREYYLWNVEPNVNQNSSAFLHELVDNLLRRNEALVISTTNKKGVELLVNADSWTPPKRYPQKMAEYKDVRVGEVNYKKTFRENEVLHLTLHQQGVRDVVDKLYDGYSKLYAVASRAYTWGQGSHLKVKVDSAPHVTPEDIQAFQNLMNEQVKPFMSSENAVLPQYNGYEYEDIGGSSNADRTTRDIRALIDDIFDFTALGFGIPPVLVRGVVQGTQDAFERFMTGAIAPIADQLEEEINRKRFGYDEWVKGTYLHIDTSTVRHFDLFSNAANVEKLIGSGAYSINDVLHAAGMAEIDEEWAKIHWLTLNIGNIEAAARAVSNPNSTKGATT